MAKYAILGGGGSFAIHTALYLLEQSPDNKVYGIGRAELRPEPFSLNIQRHPRYRYAVYHTTYDVDRLVRYLDAIEPQVIINFAAQGEGAVSWEQSWRFFETNSMGLARLVEQLSRFKWLERFIQIGSSEVYGSVDHAVTEDAPIKPTSPYAASKVAFDLYLQSMWKVKGFPSVILRPSNAYCSGQLLHRVIPRAIWSGLTGRKLPLQGGGRAKKSYIHAEDLARAIYLVADKVPPGGLYNVGPAAPTAIRDVVSLCACALGVPFKEMVEETDDRVGQDSMYWLNSTAIFDAVGWEPTITMYNGIKEVADWGRQYLDQIKDLSPDYKLRP